jgi:hypothetical protein
LANLNKGSPFDEISPKKKSPCISHELPLYIHEKHLKYNCSIIMCDSACNISQVVWTWQNTLLLATMAEGHNIGHQNVAWS